VYDERAKFETLRAAFDERVAEAAGTEQGLLVTPARPQFATEGSLSAVFTNHFAIQLPQSDLYEYKMEGIITETQRDEKHIPASAQRRDLMDRAIQHSSVLGHSLNTDSFATDGLEKIVAWKILSVPSSDARIVPPGETIEKISIPIAVRTGEDDKTQIVELKFMGTISVSNFNKACDGKIDQLPLRLGGHGEHTMTPVQAINIIIGHGVRTSNPIGQNGATQVFQIGSNKFFSSHVSNTAGRPDARGSAGTFAIGNGLIGRFGFFFTLRLTMGRPLLNISTAASAFYDDDINVAEFMRLFCNKSQTEGFSRGDVESLRGVLKGARVRIDHEKRVKTITDVAMSNNTPRAIVFQHKGQNMSVAAYLRAERGELSPNTVMSTWTADTDQLM
jgi:hypothetical protein